MRSKLMSRSERRVEKKQALTFLALVLAVSLVSFVLGVMVGRMSSPPQIVQAPEASSERVSVAVPSSAKPVSENSRPAGPDEDLTFFDSLPKGERPPMGSGINLPPQPKAKVEGAPRDRPAASTPPQEAKPPVAVSGEKPSASTAAPAAVTTTVPPTSASQGIYTLQVASFQDPADARRLEERLSSRGYSSYTEQADLGNKGVWTRVLIGPYESDQAASKAASRLLAEEKMQALVRRK